MIAYRPILYIIGTLLSFLSLAMVIPALLDIYDGDIAWVDFAYSACLTSFFGVLLMLAYRGSEYEILGIRENFILTVSCWLTLSLFAALPFAFSSLPITTTDALFETVSGLTTTGATALIGLENAPRGILLWRSLLQWLGGVGIIVMAMTILPTLHIGGMQLFQSESSDRSEKILPRVSQISSAIFSAYLFLSLTCCLLYWMTGMSFFDAICHMMATVSTAGFSTYDASFEAFNNPLVELVAIVFMLLGGCTLLVVIRFLHGDIKAFVNDTQIRAFFKIIGVATCIMTVYLWLNDTYGFWDSLRHSAFNVTAIITTTGFASSDFSNWGSFVMVFFLMLMFIGGCTGSTSGGIKIFRFQILYKAAKIQLAQLRYPSGVFVPTYNGKALKEQALLSVLAFFALYILSFVILTLGLTCCQLDITTCLSGSASALGNVGPGLGAVIGPAGNYSSFPDMAKWMMIVGMLVGRLELLTVLVLFTPGFWKT